LAPRQLHLTKWVAIPKWGWSSCPASGKESNNRNRASHWVRELNHLIKGSARDNARRKARPHGQ